MASLSHEDIVDLVTTTQRNLGPMAWTEIATDLTHYEVMSKMMTKAKAKFYTGDGIQRNVMTDTSDAARHVGLFNKDNVNIADVMNTIYIPFRHSTTSYGFDRREKAINGGPEQIVDLIKVRRADSQISMAKLMEETFWSKPADSTDKVTPWGIKNWMVSNATTGFNGGNPTGFSAGAGGLSSTTYPRWSNFTGQYTNVTKADLIATMRTAHRKTEFVSPVSIPQYRGSIGHDFRIYVNEDTISSFEDVGESTNENLGRDLAPMDGKMTFRSNPIVYVPFLDDDSTDPVYMINWGVLAFCFLKGEHMRESKLITAGDAHNVYVQHVDMSYNLTCVNRRRLALITK